MQKFLLYTTQNLKECHVSFGLTFIWSKVLNKKFLKPFFFFFLVVEITVFQDLQKEENVLNNIFFSFKIDLGVTQILVIPVQTTPYQLRVFCCTMYCTLYNKTLKNLKE